MDYKSTERDRDLKNKKISVDSKSNSYINKMLVILASTLAFVTRLFAYTASKQNWMDIFNWFTLEIQYNIMGIKENALDIIRAKYNKTDLPCKTGRIAIITGGSRGIGMVVVKMLLECDMTVIIGCRRVDAGEKAIEQIRKSGTTRGEAKVFQLDNASFESIGNFSNIIKRDYEKIHLLINNAGIMFTSFGETKDGFEQQWGVNYLSHFLLTSSLMPLLCKGGLDKNFARVINVSSCAHLLGTINFDDVNYRRNFSTKAAYAQSKLAQLMFTKSLEKIAEREDLPIRAYAVHPGIVNTDLFEHTFFYKFKWIMNLFKTPEQGATSIVYAAVNEKIEGQGGLYLSNCIESPVNPLVNDEVAREKLFKLSLQQVQLDNFY